MLVVIGLLFIVVSNQFGVVLGYFFEEVFDVVVLWLGELFVLYGVMFSGFYFCLYVLVVDGGIYCVCCKLVDGLLCQVVVVYSFMLEGLWMIGDIFNDVEVGWCVGCQIILIVNGNEMLWWLGLLCVLDYIVGCFDEVVVIVIVQQGWYMVYV